MKKYSLLAVITLLLAGPALAQMPQDAIYMPKKTIYAALMLGQSNWNWYWENTLKRENYNIGKHTTQSASLMAAVGLSDRVNLIVSLPYIETNTSAGNLLGQKGFQDLSGWLKINAVQYKGLSLHTIVGASIPVSDYVPSFLPMSIGMGAKTVSGRLLANYKHEPTGLYVTAHGTYTWRGTVQLDQDAYQFDGKVYNTNRVAVPNAMDAAVRLGILKRTFQTEVFAERFSCVAGDNIRRNDMPFLTNNMQATTVGWYGKYQPHNVGVNARASYVTDGLNMGQSTSFMLGLLYQINL